MAIDWSRGYSCQWRVYEVIPDTWADGTRVAGVESASVERSCDGDAPLLESGEIQLTVPIGTEWSERYLRLVMIAEQGGVRERVEVCTLLCSAASGETSKGVDSLRVTGRSVLYPASVACVSAGSYAPEGSDGAEFAARLLEEVLAAPVEVEGSFTLGSHIVYGAGETVLEIAWGLLGAGNFGIRVSGDGRVHIAPISTEPALLLTPDRLRLLHPTLSHELDWTDVPNRYVAIEGATVAEALNDDPNSPTSTVTRGYRHDVIDTSPVRVNGESLEGYCERMLEEQSVAYDVHDWTREWYPDVVPGDIIRVTLTSKGIEGDFRVLRQSLSCEHGLVVSEQARSEVYSWTRA